jgi:hypothetical protein
VSKVNIIAAIMLSTAKAIMVLMRLARCETRSDARGDLAGDLSSPGGP